MHQENFRVIWDDIREDIRRNWDRLTDDDIDSIGGDFESLLGFLQDRYGYSRQEASMDFDRFMRSIGRQVDDLHL